MPTPQIIIPVERIASRIYLIRGEKVMIDSDLADLYGVETGALVRAVKRNSNRFPEDFSFQISDLEFENLKCQTGTSKQWGGRRSLPHVFTEQGVALSSVLRSTRAAEVNIAIIRTFVKLREVLAIISHFPGLPARQQIKSIRGRLTPPPGPVLLAAKSPSWFPEKTVVRARMDVARLTKLSTLSIIDIEKDWRDESDLDRVSAKYRAVSGCRAASTRRHHQEWPSACCSGFCGVLRNGH
jgi:hypothetical protein